MSRYNRVNLDGKSITETRLADANILPGTFAVINSTDEFIAATAAMMGRLYVINPAYHEGLGITDAVPAGHSAIGEYVEEGREMAVLVGAATYNKDDAIVVGASGRGAKGTVAVIGYCQDDVVLAAEGFIRVRFRSDVASDAEA